MGMDKDKEVEATEPEPEDYDWANWDGVCQYGEDCPACED